MKRVMSITDIAEPTDRFLTFILIGHIKVFNNNTTKKAKPSIAENTPKVKSSFCHGKSIILANTKLPKAVKSADSKNKTNRADRAIIAHALRKKLRFLLYFTPYIKSPSLDIWLSKVVQEKIAVITNKTVAPELTFLAVFTMVCPAKRNSSGSREVTRSYRSTLNTPNAVTSKKARGIKEDRKKYTHAPATVVILF